MSFTLVLIVIVLVVVAIAFYDRGKGPEQAMVLVINPGSEEQCVGRPIVRRSAAERDRPQTLNRDRALLAVDVAQELAGSFIEGRNLSAAAV